MKKQSTIFVSFMLFSFFFAMATSNANQNACSELPQFSLTTPIPPIAYDPTRLDGIPGDPAVIKYKNGYVMYYGAAKGDWTDQNTIHIFRATSIDGKNWIRTSEPILSPSPAPNWDSVKIETPYVMENPDGELTMYYSGSNKPDSETGFAVGVAYSSDGKSWKKRTQPVLSPDNDELSIIGPSVYLDKTNQKYYMWYAAINNQYGIDIRKAESNDGISWKRNGIVLKLDIDRIHDTDIGVMGPDVIVTSRGYEMLYNVLSGEQHNNSSETIWHAVSKDGINWTKTPYAIAKIDKDSNWLSSGIGSQSWLYNESTYKIWFVGTKTDYKSTWNNGIGLMESANCADKADKSN
ncbi:MAG: hypothetical protein ABL867_09110 [Rickettsiales bacterium]